MVSTPETMTAAQRAVRLQLAPPPSSGHITVAHNSKISPDKLSLARAALAVAPPRNAMAGIDVKSDHDMSFMLLDINEIDYYEFNPRTSDNPRYQEIYDSIKRDNITNPITVTRRPGASKYTPYGGGNTRLKIGKALLALGDQRFRYLNVVVKAWQGDANTISAHLAENENRGDISFWEKAQGVQSFQREFENEHATKLTTGELNKELLVRGIKFGAKTVQNFIFALEYLAPVGPWLTARDVNTTIKPAVAGVMEIASRMNLKEPVNAALQTLLVQQRVGLEALVHSNKDLDAEDRQPEVLDAEEVIQSLYDVAAPIFGCSRAHLPLLLEALVANSKLDGLALRAMAQASLTQALAPEPPAAPVQPPLMPMLGLLGGQQRSHLPTMPAVPQNAPSAAQRPAQAGAAAAAHPGASHAPAQSAGEAADRPPGALGWEDAPAAGASVPALYADMPQEPIAAVRYFLAQIDTLIPMSEWIVGYEGMPLGYFIDLPDVSWVPTQFGSEADPAEIVQAALWKLLAILSGQFDVTVMARFPAGAAQGSSWAACVELGLGDGQRKAPFDEAFSAKLPGHNVWGQTSLNVRELSLLFQHPVANPLQGLMAAMQNARHVYPERFPQGFEPLFGYPGNWARIS